MENEKLDLQVGDRVTYIYDNEERQRIISNKGERDYYSENTKIIKIERPHYEVVEEKKELLTEEEKEFLKNICKYYDIRTIYFNKVDIRFYNEDNSTVSALNYPENMEFNKVEKYKYYTLEELGLEEL